MNFKELKSAIINGNFDKSFNKLYPCGAIEARQRFLSLLEGFALEYGECDGIRLFSAPGRTEIGGNHTDHQGGRVLAAGIDKDIIAACAPSKTRIVSIKSENYDRDTVGLASLNPKAGERNTSAALIRGIAAGFINKGFSVGGFNAFTASNVKKGSGLSSSAAFEVLIGTAINGLFCNNAVDMPTIAKIGQYAENKYFMKPCGLMDQMASAVGSVISIDFHDDDCPLIDRIELDLEQHGYALCIIDSNSSHSGLTGDYAAVPAEMCAVAKALGVNVLSQTNFVALTENAVAIRRSCGDRAFLRAAHFFGENERVARQKEFLKSGAFDDFLAEVSASGRSSFMYLQNVCTYSNPADEGVAVALLLCDSLLKGRGAFRVHGGGFAGTVQAFVPLDTVNDFKRNIEGILGKGACHIMTIRSVGGTEIVPE